MKIIRIVLLVVVVIVLVAVVGGAIAYNRITQSPLPQHEGQLTVAGLNDTVEILRDSWGVPHIYASNAHDLFFAQGYTHAQDRWWQMEFSRHIGSGAIEELVGKRESTLGDDVFIRTLGWRRVAEQEVALLDDITRSYMQAFADGVNTYISSRTPGELALEYSLLGLTGISIEIAPWSPADTLVWGKVMAWNLSGNHDEELLRAELFEAIGEEMTNAWGPPYPFGQKPTIVWPEELPITETSLTTQSSAMNGTTGGGTMLAGNVAPGISFMMGRGRDIGSNNWVVGGAMTESGSPMLANDPHLGIQMPSIWYEIGLHCQPVSEQCPINVVGFTFSPTAGVIIGHNDRIAWGVTNVGPDVQDLYHIRVNPENPLQYEWNGEWRDMTVREETIRFGDGEPSITIQVRETHLGPIINDNRVDEETGELLGFNNEDPLAMRWTALEPGTIFLAVAKLNAAQNWEEFREALQYWDVPSQNFVYADVDGNIGYQTPGKIPIRASDHNGLLPVEGWTDEFEWQGYIPFELLPRVLNPARNYVATANQAVVPLEYYDQLAAELGEDRNYVISYDWAIGYRGQRINELLESLAPHTVETFGQIHGDNKNVSAEELMPYLADLSFDDSALAEARDWLLEWDFQMHMDSGQAALYAAFWKRLMENLYNDQLPEDVRTSGSGQQMWGTVLLAADPENVWWDDARTEALETRDDILSRSFAQGYADVVEVLGADRSKWRWGALHTATFVSNPLGQSGIDVIENIVNRGPVAASGGSEIVNATGWSANRDFTVLSLPSERIIVDLGDFTRSVAVTTTGQSGHPFSEHYQDQIESWRNIEYHPLLWTRQQVEAAAGHRLVLNPAS